MTPMSPSLLALSLTAGTRVKEIALVVFFLLFLGLLVWLLFSRSDRYRRAARLPLEEDDPGRRPAERSETKGDSRDG